MAGVITTGSIPKALWEGINNWWGIFYNDYKPQYLDLFNKDYSFTRRYLLTPNDSNNIRTSDDKNSDHHLMFSYQDTLLTEICSWSICPSPTKSSFEEATGSRNGNTIRNVTIFAGKTTVCTFLNILKTQKDAESVGGGGREPSEPKKPVN